MIRKFTFVMMACLLGVAANAQEWVSFGSKAVGVPPEINLQQNDNQAVSFSVGLSGMYVESKTEASVGYKRLSMPQCQTTGEVGAPEIPVVIKMIAVPECSDIQVVVNKSGVQTFSNYTVYPVPEQQPRSDDGETFYVEEVFTKDATVYAQNIAMPIEDYSALESGYLRSQRYLQLELHPVQYNPVTQTLTVATEMEVTLTFVGATTPVNVNLGIFGNVGKKMLNYTNQQDIKASVNDKAFEKSGFQKGNVQWKRLSAYWDVENVTADYLIICANAFFNGTKPHDTILRLANHRAEYNGFDVLILNVEDIISDGKGFYFEEQDEHSGPDYLYKKEQRIRTCIKTIWETGTANHTYDGKLGYVLLVGDTEGGQALNAGMPTSYNHGTLGYKPTNPYYEFNVYASDYYYSCITKKPNGEYDRTGDVYIGRFCVPNNLNVGFDGGLTRLSNMVRKTINYETDFKPEFKKYVNLGYGGDLVAGGGYYNKLLSYVVPFLQEQMVYGVNAYADGEDPTIFGNKIMGMLNGESRGGVFNMYAHGGVQHWWSGSDSPPNFSPILRINSFRQKLNNAHEQPFCMSMSCLTGRFDDPAYNYCLAEAMTSYSDSVGFIGMLAASTLSSQVELKDVEKGYQAQIIAAIYGNLSHIMGEFVLEAIIGTNLSDALMHNLFGDPALNIMAEGYEIWRPTTLRENTTNISCKITVKGIAGDLIIPENKQLFLDTNGNITIENKGKITMKTNSKITSFTEHSSDRFIKVEDGGGIWCNTNCTATIENISLTSDMASLYINFNNVKHTRGNNPISSYGIRHCTFTNSTITINGSKPAGIENCTFTDTEISCVGNKSVNPTDAITLNNSIFVRSPISHKYYKLKATNNCAFSDRSDITATYSIVDIQNCKFWKSGFMATIPDNLPMPLPPFTPTATINKSSFRNTGKFIIGYNDLEQPIYCSASIMLDRIKEFQITGDTIINANASAPKGVDPGGGNVQTSPYGEGIYLNNAGQGNVDNRLISGNDISACEIGLHVYNSKATFKNNDIHNNTSGIRLLNNSSTSFSGDTNPANGKQYIRDNTSHQLYATKGSFPAPFKFNLIRKDNNPHSYPWIYYDVSGKSTTLDVTGNCWGSNFVPATDLYPAGWYDYLFSWCPGAEGKSSTPAEELYQVALDYFAAENYASAHTSFLNLVATYPEDELAIAALHELFALEQFLSEDYSALHNYYAAFTPAYTTLFDAADFLATRCNVADQNWQPAIDWYENRIAEPPSYPDSIFAVIDLGDIHLMMESDSLKAGRVLRFPNLIPKSKREYEENKAELLATLPKVEQPKHPLAETGKTGILSQNIPNPANGSTTVVYDVIKDGQVELRMYNQLGQLLQLLPQGTKKEGTYRIEISLAGLPAGMYHYILFINGEKADAKKLIVQ